MSTTNVLHVSLTCPRCGALVTTTVHDAFLRVLVRGDVIVGVEPDMQRRGYVPD